MDIILAIVVASAVIVFGALISMGNERQRKAIDDLREQILSWAIQDLEFRVTNLAQGVKIEDPHLWLKNFIFDTCRFQINLQNIEWNSDSQFLLCTSEDYTRNVIFTPYSPSDIKKIKRNIPKRTRKLISTNPLIHLSSDTVSHELSTINNGILFSLELEFVWNKLTDQKLTPRSSLWVYEHTNK